MSSTRELGPSCPRRIAVLGSTGSIGKSTIDVVRFRPEELKIEGLAAHSNWQELARQCQEFQPRYAVLTDQKILPSVDRSHFPRETQFLSGQDGIIRLVTDPDIDVVVSAVVGSAGLMGTWAAIETGKTVALANKETLILAGSLVMNLAARRGGRIIPVDSEHSAIFQALTDHPISEVERVVLTASGGPFRGKSIQDLENVSVEEALRHPTWQMGPKISIDSATMMNKALEVIEARWLFDLESHQIDVIVHPASVVHSFVEFIDGSVLAQLSPPDMRLPIQYALLYPKRKASPARKLDWKSLRELSFEPVDHETFPAIQLGFEVAKNGGTCGAVLNAANEAAVARFLKHEIAFRDIVTCCRSILENHDYESSPSLDGLLAADQRARQEVECWTSH